jgi:hypothetical protein
MARFRRLYGAGLLHAAGIAASFAVAGLAVRRWLDAGASDTRAILTWFVGAILAHDLVLVPLYSLADRLLSRPPARAPGPARFARARAHARIPALLSGLLLLVFSPLILRASRGSYGAASALSPEPYVDRWLIATAALFAVSALAYVGRVVAGARRTRATRRARQWTRRRPRGPAPR